MPDNKFSSSEPTTKDDIKPAKASKDSAAPVAPSSPNPPPAEAPTAVLLKNLITPKGRGMGYKPDTHDKSKDPSVRALLGAPMRLASAASIENFMKGIYNQLQTSSCTGWAFAQAIMLRIAVLGLNIPLPSPEAIYVFGRAIARQQAGQDATTPLTDSGAQPSLIVQGINQWGAPSSAAWPFDPNTINDEPNFAELEAAAAFLIQSCNRISSTGAGRLQDVRHALASGYPVIIGTAVDEAFENYMGGTNKKTGLPNVVTAPDPSKVLGGHMLHLVGYDANSLFRGVNQWGTSWGDRGLFWADESWITSDLLTDCYVLACSASGR
jgi:hypothetical protein